MKLAIVSHTLVSRASNGRWLTFNRVGEIVDGLAERGWRTTLVSREGEGEIEFATYPLSTDVRLRTVPAYSGRLASPRRWLALLRALSDADAALVFMPSLFAALASLVLGRRAVIYAGGTWSQRDDFPRWRGVLESLAARRVAGVVVSGHSVAAHFRGRAKRVHICVPLVPEEVNRRLRLNQVEYADPSPLRVLFVGSVVPAKGVPELLDALRDLPEVECRIVGQSDDPVLARSVRREAVRRSNLTADPYLDWPDLRKAYQWANVLALPSHTEGFPRVIFEAVAFGLALVLTPVGGIPSRLEDGKDALFVPVGNAGALRAALAGLAGDPLRTTELARSARQTLAGVFVDPDSSAQFDRLLRAIGNGRTHAEAAGSSSEAAVPEHVP